MLYILYGEDDFSLKEALAGLKAELGGEMGVANIAVLEGQRLSPDELIAACNTVPFLAPRRLIIVEGLLGCFEPRDRRRGQRPALGEWRALEGYVGTMPPSTELILVDGKISRGNPLLKELAPRANVREFPPLKWAELRRWIQYRVQRGGGEISPQALQLLAHLVGENLWLLSSEIDKLCLYAQGRRIEEGDVRSLVSYAKDANIFVLVDAIIQRRLATATQLLHQLMDEGEAPSYLLFMTTRQFRLLLRAKELSSQSLSSAELATRLGLSGFMLPRVLEQAQRYPSARLRNVYHQLLDADISIKTGRLRGELALELLLAELCHEG